MKLKEIVQALRCRARHEKATNEGCKKCPYWATENLEEWQKLCGWASCKVYQIISDAADAIERLTAENAKAEAERDALLEQIKARRSCSDCKHFDYCEFYDADVIACMNCVTKNCPCRQCVNSSRWEWRGLPKTPEGGDKLMLDICPISLAEANAFVEEHHRHHKPVVGHKFSIGCTDGEKIVGVAIVGRPVARYLDDGWTLEVNRCCTDGTRNACSILYAAAWRAARAMGYHKLITCILDTEPGTSLTAAGWKCVGQAGGLRWTGKRRPEVDLCPAQMKIRFEREEGEKA